MLQTSYAFAIMDHTQSVRHTGNIVHTSGFAEKKNDLIVPRNTIRSIDKAGRDSRLRPRSQRIVRLCGERMSTEVLQARTSLNAALEGQLVCRVESQQKTRNPG